MLNDIDTEKGVYADPAPPNNHHIQNGPGHETPLTEVVEDLAGSVQDEKSVDTWKYPRINLWRYLATLFCMLMLGANDASIGVCALRINFSNLQLTSSRPYFHTYRNTTASATPLWQPCS